jgi:hypothetical protein
MFLELNEERSMFGNGNTVLDASQETSLLVYSGVEILVAVPVYLVGLCERLG